MFERIEHEFGTLDILVSNARPELAAFYRTPMELTVEQLRVALDSQAQAFLVEVQTVARLMPDGGRIIAISSVVGQMGNAGQTNYAASKAGLIGFAKALAREVASRSITVNIIAPGMIETDMTRAITDKAQVDWASQIPLGRLGTVNDVAAAACFLASDEASYITGHVLAVNGGMYT